MLSVENFIPNSMEFIRAIVARNWESISTLVSFRIFITKARSSVERLVQISHVMDHKSKSIGFSGIVISRVESMLDIVIHVSLLVVFTVLTRKPVYDIVNGNYNVIGRNNIRSRIIGSGFTRLVNEGIVNEMEICLPHTSMVLNIVSEGSTLNERVTSFMACEIRIEVSESHKLTESSLECRSIVICQ